MLKQLPLVNRRSFLFGSTATAVAAFARANGLRTLSERKVALCVVDCGDVVRLKQLLDQVTPGHQLTLIATADEINRVAATDHYFWQSCVQQGHELGYRTGNASIVTDWHHWRKAISAASSQAPLPTVALCDQTTPHVQLAALCARHNMLVVCRQHPRSKQPVDQLKDEGVAVVSMAADDDAVTLAAQMLHHRLQSLGLAEYCRRQAAGFVQPIEYYLAHPNG